MPPLICLIIVTALAELWRRYAPSDYFASFVDSVRVGLSVMFLFTASAHFNKMKVDLARAVPSWVPKPAFTVWITGELEILGAVALLVPSLARPAALAFIVFLVAVFPANARAAQLRLTIGGRPTLGLWPRAAIQLLFLAACARVVIG